MTIDEYYKIYQNFLATGISCKEAYLATSAIHSERTGGPRYKNYATHRTMISEYNRKLAIKYRSIKKSIIPK
jgi:hypothetical protein